MRSQKSWNEVVAQVERSGLTQEKQLMQQNYERQFKVQQELMDQINIAINRRNEQQRQKKNERMAVETQCRNLSEKEKKDKEQYKQKEQKFRIENFRMLNQKNQVELLNSEGFKQPIYKQNPITETLYGKSEIRAKKQRDYKKQFDQINHELAESRIKSQIQMKRMNQKEVQQSRNQMEQRFKKIEEQRYKFKKVCLDGKHKTEQKLNTQPDSLEKQYSLYLEKQIVEKKNRPDYSIFRAQRDDKILDQNLLKINHNPQIQSSSPAYLGRIPYNYDRQRQLEYLNREVHRHQRTKTEGPLSPAIQQKKAPQEPALQSKSTKIIPTIVPTPQLKSVERKNSKDYKFYNIITGNMMVRREGFNGL